MAGAALAESARVGGSETIRPGWRVVCAGQERRPAGQGDCHSAQEAGAATAEVARDATELPEAGPVTDAGRRRKNGRRAGFRIGEDQPAQGGPSGVAGDVPISTRQGPAESR